jgi:4'-phosphopantetheinyl transferase
MTLGFLIRDLCRVPAGDDWLTAAERQRLAGRRSAKRIADWRLGRWTAKETIAAFLERQGQPPPARIEVLAAEDGSPEAFAGGQPLPLSLSLSHAAGRALCAVGPPGISLGCDLESIEPRGPAFVDSYLTGSEAAALADVDDASRALLVNLIWSAKESALKALRCGLRADTRSVEVKVSPEANGVWHPLEVVSRREGTSFAGRWRQVGGQVATIVSRPPPGRLADLD